MTEPAPPSPEPPPAAARPSAPMWFGLGGLVVVALSVVFVLPAVVAEYELPLPRAAGPAPPPAPPPAAAEVSPFEAAQRSRERTAAQDALAALLERQAELDAMAVDRWGRREYEAALAEAEAGDGHYREGGFALAAEYYARGRDRLAGLLAGAPAAAARLLAEGADALAAGDARTAADRFSLARTLLPDSEEARAGLARARVFDEVERLLRRAGELAGDGELEAAREVYREAAALDGRNEEAPRRLGELDVLIAEREFAGVMSRGYALMEAGEPERAIAAFRQAQALGIRRAEAGAAIAQVEDQVAGARIDAIRADIAGDEADERWREAVAGYDKALAIDPSLVFAASGRDYAGKRAHLDRLLTDVIGDPERLGEDAVFEQAVDVYHTGRAIEDPGPRLAGQLERLERLLDAARVPATVELRSDGLTDVTVLRVGPVGKFEARSLTLSPGRYVAVGRRIGYRDVRREFAVGFGNEPGAIEVRCTERVAAGYRR